MEQSLLQKIDSLPEAPGVYLMKDRTGRIIYVGKANSLRSRVRSYIEPSGDQRAFVPLLERTLGDIDTVLVSNEKEALLLENELVRQHRPRFNVKLLNGQNFIYLRIDTKQRYPRVEVVRKVCNDGARYFGPYPAASALRETLRVVNRYFQLRTCADHKDEPHKRPCLLCQIARFPAPSVYDIPPEEYRRHVEAAILFLQGRRTELVDSLRVQMAEAAASLRFELAARLRDQIAAIEQTIEPQSVVLTTRLDQDVFAPCREGDRMVVYVLFVREGRVIGGRSFPQSGQKFPDAEVLASFVNLYYSSSNLIPDEVLLAMGIEGADSLANLLSERKASKVKILVPQRGGRRELVRLALRNAAQELQGAGRGRKESNTTALEGLREALHLNRVPRRMECFDISHFQSAAIVASRVTMTDGALDRSRYRRFRIRGVQVQDDYACMYEVVRRRLQQGIAENDLPDLLVIDGGRGQLASAQAALRDSKALGVEVIALAKSREAETPGQYEAGQRTPERIFVPGRKEPIVLPANSPELLLLDRLRDEAHRFALRYQQRSMRRAALRSGLEDIPGIGRVRLRLLLSHFGSFEGVRAASVAELAVVVGKSLAQRIDAALHPTPTPSIGPGLDSELHDRATLVHPG